MTTASSLKNAKLIDFTKSLDGFRFFPGFNEKVVSLIRDGSGSRLLVVIDRGYSFREPGVHLVRDHLNLTGFNPLVGANDSCGERFPSVNGVYVDDVLPQLPRGVAAGMKAGAAPTADEVEFLRSLGADFVCYNLVPTMIVAAHAGCRVIGLVAPEGADLKAVLKDLID